MPLLLAGRILRTNHVRGAALAVALALVPLVVIFIVADGMIEGITARYVELKSYHGRAYLPEGEDGPRAVAAAREVGGVTGAWLEIEGEGLLRFSAGSSAVRLRCVDPRLGEDRGFARYLELIEGAFDLSAPGTAVVGSRTAEAMGIRVGDEIRLATIASAGLSALPRLARARVTGIFGTGYQELDRNWVFIPAADGERLLAEGRRARFVGVKLSDPFGDRAPTMRLLRAALPSARVYDWYQLELNQFRSFEVTRNLLVFVMALVVVVGAVNVSSAVLMVVLERRQDLGILKSMGASPAAVRRVFLVVGLAVGAVGSLGGVLLGLLVGIHVNELFGVVESSVNAAVALLGRLRTGAGSGGGGFRILGGEYYLDRIPIRVRLPELWAAAAGNVLLSAIAAWIPALRAGRLRPLDVIRKH